MKIAQLSVLAALVFATQGAFAQTSGGPGAPATGGASDASAVTNAGSALTTDTTVTDTTDTTITPDTLPAGEMANTGGEPQLMLLAGMLLATGGLLIRRKAGAQSL